MGTNHRQNGSALPFRPNWTYAGVELASSAALHWREEKKKLKAAERHLRAQNCGLFFLLITQQKKKKEKAGAQSASAGQPMKVLHKLYDNRIKASRGGGETTHTSCFHPICCSEILWMREQLLSSSGSSEHSLAHANKKQKNNLCIPFHLHSLISTNFPHDE